MAKSLSSFRASSGMGSPSDLVEYTCETLNSITGGFSPRNHMGSTQGGDLFRGKTLQGMETREVVVKIWETPSDLRKYPRFSGPGPDLRQSRLKAEIKILTDSVLCGHPNMVKLNGYCFENGYYFGVVYDLEPLDNVHKFVLQGHWTDKTHVFAYGIVLLGLIAKRRAYDKSLDSRRGMNDGNTTYYWALEEYNTKPHSKFWGKFKKRKPKSLVHKSFEMDPYFDADDGIKITKLAMDCIGDDPKQRPTMKTSRLLSARTKCCFGVTGT